MGATKSHQTVRHGIFDENCFQWNIDQVPETLIVQGQPRPHPARTSAIFVVHGMGEQTLAETAALLRAGFDDALTAIYNWQNDHDCVPIPHDTFLPPPYIMDGFWGDYPNVSTTFPEEWKKFDEGAKLFFTHLWKMRTVSAFRVYRWFIAQLLRLLSPRVVRDLGFLSWLLYFPYQVTALTTLTASLIRAPRVLTGFLGDLRLYFDPRGVTERAIVQRIDHRVAEKFLRLMGLDIDFRELPEDQWYQSCGVPLRFERIIWVAHSLGSVISYNVLSDLFHRAIAIEQAARTNPDTARDQLDGVRRFRRNMRRFITIGSPLDKVAFLYGRKALTPWPAGSRKALLDGGEGDDTDREWWVNFYSVLDPVAGSLESPLICGDEPPLNLHAAAGFLPGYAHVGYWRDSDVLRYILGRTFGKDVLIDRKPRRWPAWSRVVLALGFHLLHLALAVLIILVVIWGISYLTGLSREGLSDFVTGMLGVR